MMTAGDRGRMLYSIHFLRFIAATGVVVHHSDVLLRWNIVVGSAGVDLFFVISGVVIGLSTPPEMSIRDFLVRRFIRIFPLYWLALTAWVTYWFGNGGVLALEDVVTSALLIPDLSRVWTPVYLPAWTLVFEIFFYAVFAACMLSGRFARPLCCVVLAAVALKFSQPGNPQIYYGLAMLLFAVAATPTSMPREIYWGIPAVLLVFGMLGFERLDFFRSRVALFDGNASYAIYLSHFIVLQAIFQIATRHGFPAEQHRLILAAIAIPAALALGGLLYVAVDKPLLSWLRRMLLHERDERQRLVVFHST